MGTTSARRRTLRRSFKSPGEMKTEALSARQVKYAVENKELKVSFMTSLQACAKKKDLEQGTRIHADIRASGLLEKDMYIGNTLVSMYAKCGALDRAQQVVNELPIRDVVSWTALISGYIQHGKGREAILCFHRMQSEGLSPNAFTYSCILKACGVTKDIAMGKQIHDEIVSQGLLKRDVVLGSALVDMYAKCGLLLKAQKVFDELPICDTVVWNTLIAGYTQQGQGKEALGCFHRMQSEGHSPTATTYACILKACGIIQDADMGKQIHDVIISQGLLGNNIVLGNSLVEMYARCGVFMKAHEVLDGLPFRNVVSWTTLIGGYVQHGKGKEALGCFRRMQSEGLAPNTITYCWILKACGLMQDVDMGKQIHDVIAIEGLLERDVLLGSALVDMYAKCGVLLKAQEVFDKLSIRDAVSWNALIAGYAQQGQGQEALGCFNRMQSAGFSPTPVTYACILKASGIMQDIDMGEKIQDEIIRQGLLAKHVVLGNALVDMYAKCGILSKAQKVFDELPLRNEVSWNALIAGYAQQGEGQKALGCFYRMRSKGFSPNVVSWTALIGGYVHQGLAKEALDCFLWMQQEGISPNAITFLNVLNACNRSGLVDRGQTYFDSMREKYGIAPEKKHYTCMVGLFGCARLFDKAMRIVRMMPSFDYPPVWSALLGACQKWENVNLGRVAFERAVQLDVFDAGAYVSMSDIYAAAGMQEEAQNTVRIKVKNTVG